MTEYKWMRRAIELAKQGEGWTSPNPLVGAVIVKQGQIIGEGYHARYGEYHAERNALMACTEPAEGADLYVTLEPCCHYGKQPPCVEAIVQAGIRRVFVGSDDPNPLVAGKGIRYLRERGITVETHVLKEECDRLNPVFFHYIRKKTPFVVMKYAMTLDAVPELAYSLTRIIRSIYGKNKKVLALDLDNTLWGGVIGDDGQEGIAIGQETAEAEAYTEVQEYCKAQKQLGVLLTVCSKNEPENAKLGQSHPDSVQ